MRKIALLALLLASCSHSRSSTRPATLPGTGASAVPVVVQLIARPSVIDAAVPSPTPAESRKVRLTLLVHNPTGRTYSGSAPDSAIAQFAMTVDGEPIWSWPAAVSGTPAAVTIGPGGTEAYEVYCEIPDTRVFKGKVLVVHAKFNPTGSKAETRVEIR